MVREEMFKDDLSRRYSSERAAKAAKGRGDKIIYDASTDSFYLVHPKRHNFWRV